MPPDFTRLIRPGDRLALSAGPMAPVALTEHLNQQLDGLPKDLTVLLNFMIGDGLDAERLARHARVAALGGSGSNRRYQEHGVLDVLPAHYSMLPTLVRRDTMRPDVILLQAARSAGGHNLSLMIDHVAHALDLARELVVEVNDQAPVTFGDTEVELPSGAHILECSHPLFEVPSRPARDKEKRVAELVNSLVRDGDTLQMGIGSLPDAVLAGLTNKRDLGIHTGTMGDRMMQLMQAGVVTNRRKNIDPGKTVTGVLMGTSELYRWVHLNEAIEMRGPDYTHDSLVVGTIENLVSINAALEVDLTGQVNGEVAGDRHVGLIGGSGDFTRGAVRSPGGRAILVLDSTARGGTISRIVPKLSAGVVTTGRGDTDFVVTEYGIAELRGRPVSERAAALIDIAHPDFRDELRAKADEGLM